MSHDHDKFCPCAAAGVLDAAEDFIFGDVPSDANDEGVTEAEVIRGAVDKELLRSSLGAGIVTGSGGGLNGADLTRDTRHIWLEGFGES